MDESQNAVIMISLQGTTIKKPNWLDLLRPVEHLVFFEFPLVSHLRSTTGENFLKIWCDVQDGTNRYVLFSLTQEDLGSYRRQEIPLRQLVTTLQDGFVYFLEEDIDDVSVIIVSGVNLPQNYLPAEDSFFNPSDCVEAQESPTYEISLNNNWSLEELKSLPHTFLQTYALLYCLDHASSSISQAVKNAFAAYPWRGGFSRVHFYKHLKTIIPKPNQATVKSMHFASPGWIELSLDKEVGLEIGNLVNEYIQNAEAISDAVKYINHQLSQRQLRGNNSKSIAATLSSADLSFCATSFDEICRLWKFKSAPVIRAIAANELAALKILISFQKRIHTLAEFQISEQAVFERTKS